MTRGSSWIRVTAMWKSNSSRHRLALVAISARDGAGDRRGGDGSGVQASGMCPSPASSPRSDRGRSSPRRAIDFGPGVQVGKVAVRPGRAVERLHVGASAGSGSRRRSARPAPGAAGPAPAARPSRGRSRCPASSVSSQRLHARLHADDVADRPAAALVELDQKIDRASAALAHVARPGLAELRAGRSRSPG